MNKSRRYYYRHKEERLKYNHKYYVQLRQDVLALLGNRCTRCKIDDPRVLQIDHINGGGSEQRRTVTSWSIYKSVLKAQGVGFQLLCANCNFIKRYEMYEGITRMQEASNATV